MISFSYEAAREFLLSRGRFSGTPGLHRIQRVMGAFGNPQDALRVVHVAGTNGKGSTCAFIERALREAGYCVGLFSSPHLHSIRERIMVNGVPISRDDFARMLHQVHQMAQQVLPDEQSLTFFEYLTAMMYLYLRDQSVDFLIQEVGLGGRFDATTVIRQPVVSVISEISLDHTALLGDTVGEIAWEKAGIVKDGCPTVTSAQADEALRAIAEVCEEHRSPLRILREAPMMGWGYRLLSFDCSGGAFEFRGDRWHVPAVQIRMLGKHQVRNAALALLALEAVGLGDELLPVLVSGLGKAHWPGRLECMQQAPIVLLDGAHNLQGAEVLAENLRHICTAPRTHSVLAISKGKDFRPMLERMSPVLTGHVWVTTFPGSISLDTLLPAAKETLRHATSVSSVDSATDAVKQALRRSAPSDALVIWGSLYLVGETRDLWQAPPDTDVD